MFVKEVGLCTNILYVNFNIFLVICIFYEALLFHNNTVLDNGVGPGAKCNFKHCQFVEGNDVTGDKQNAQHQSTVTCG